MPLTQGSSPTQKGSAFTFQQVHTFEIMFFTEVVLKSEVLQVTSRGLIEAMTQIEKVLLCHFSRGSPSPASPFEVSLEGHRHTFNPVLIY